MKTRITVRCMGIPRQIFSITERSNGDLIVAMTGSHCFGSLDDEEAHYEKRQTENRFSIHRSLRSVEKAHTIKHTSRYSNGSERTAAQLVTYSHGQLYARTFTYLLPNVGSEQFSFVPKRKDNFLHLPHDIFPQHNQIVHVFVASKDALPLVSPNASTYGLSFSHFRVFLYCQYVNLPTTERSAMVVAATRPPEENGRRLPSHFDSAQIDDTTFTGVQQRLEVDIEYELYYPASACAAFHALQMAEALDEMRPDLAGRIRRTPLIFSKYPTPPDAICVVSPPVYERDLKRAKPWGRGKGMGRT